MKHFILILASLIATSAFAADGGFYTYGAIGQSSTNRKGQTDDAITGAGVTAFTSSADQTDTAWKLQAGWRFNSYLAVEGGYVDLGKFTFDANYIAPFAGTRDGSLKTEAWNLGLVGSLPINEQFSLFAKGGLFSYKAKFQCSGTAIACPNPSRSDSGIPFYYGVGAAWNFNRNWFLRAEYEIYTNIGERYNIDGSTGTSRSDVKIGSIGVGYRF